MTKVDDFGMSNARMAEMYFEKLVLEEYVNQLEAKWLNEYVIFYFFCIFLFFMFFFDCVHWIILHNSTNCC